MTSDFVALVALALDGRPGPLQHALKQLALRLRRPLTSADYPQCVLNMLEAFAPFAQANGMPKRGRPSSDPEKEQMRVAYRAWVDSLVRDGYKKNRLMAQITKESGGREIIGKDDYPIDVEPSDHAHGVVGDEFGVGSDAIKKMLRKARKKGTPD